MTEDGTHINGCGSYLDIGLAMAAVDAAVNAGHAHADLRWRCSPAQRTRIVTLMATVATSERITQIMTEATYLRLVTFCGLPCLVDKAMPPDSIVLEKVAVSIPVVAEIRRLATPPGYPTEAA